MCVQSMHLYCQQSQRPYQCCQSIQSCSFEYNRVGGVCLVHCDMWCPHVWWFRVCLFGGLYVFKTAPRSRKQRSVTTGLGWKCFPSQISSSACQKDCLHCNMWGSACIVTFGTESVCLWMFSMEMVCFVEVGISEYKCILLCLSCFKHYMELNSMSLIFMLFWTTKKEGSGCVNSEEALPHCDMQPTMI